jgi:hypothetical protein
MHQPQEGAEMNSAIHHYSAAQHQADLMREARRNATLPRHDAVAEPARLGLTAGLRRRLARPRLADLVLDRR